MNRHCTLYAPSRERIVASNAWAFLHRLATIDGIRLADWGALHRWSVAQPARFRSAVTAFAAPVLSGPGLLETAALLLHLDLRPDDRLLLGSGALLPGGCCVAIARARGPAEALLREAAHTRASIIVAPAASFAKALFRQSAERHDLSSLRTLVVLGGPLAPEARARVYTWVKADVLLLARAGDRIWGDPLSPVLRAPPAGPALGVARLRRLSARDRDAR